MFISLVFCLVFINEISSYSYYGRTRKTVYEPTRKTIYGWIRGKVTTRVPRFKVEEYLGMPYALPPIGQFRFKRPQEPNRWHPRVLKTTTIPPACPTINLAYIQWHKPGFTNLNEDCLYMNIYKPLTRQRKLPVLLFIHGGSNADGMGAMVDGDILAAYGQIIVVTFNFRVSVLGFYANESLGIKGNNGLMDQVLAMKWVQRNIRYFGGDPSRVTIYGHSSGAGDVGVFLISPLTKGLFRNAIMHSGSPIAFWFMSNCVRSGNTLVIPKECNRGTSLVSNETVKAEILKLTKGSSITDFFSSIRFGQDEYPSVIDGDIITDSPDKLYTCGRFHTNSVLFITARDEGLQANPPAIEDYYANKTIDDIVNESYNLFPERLIQFDDDIRKAYKEWTRGDTFLNYSHYLQMNADKWFFTPMMKTADRIAEKLKEVYILSFQYISENKPGPDWTGRWSYIQQDKQYTIYINVLHCYKIILCK